MIYDNGESRGKFSGNFCMIVRMFLPVTEYVMQSFYTWCRKEEKKEREEGNVYV